MSNSHLIWPSYRSKVAIKKNPTRLVGWNKERVRKLAVGIKMIELYNSAAKQKIDVVRKNGTL